MQSEVSTKIMRLLVCRIVLWIIAAVSTGYWIYFSIKLHRDGIFDPAEYSTALRPVLYTCLVIAVIAICISFVLHHLSKKLKAKEKETTV
ncbi:hypothetical protein [Butyrivibrio sp. VCB2006]|uniref:hypothetical protein n=1 Tax=Butyrivibrio sp. VCB2006 TaxID=1280679 RepID=UPI00041B130D|nr:hypothetical protein [Butyrivibrio sp. VCB2006]